jgi:predicted NUDIX family NTP pyrophosphohydrolase
MAQRSAGILMFRRMGAGLALLLVHPGGPYWANKDEGAWSIPKGICAAGEDELAAARREFHEETGGVVEGELVELGAFRQPGGKTIAAWAVEGMFDPATLVSNTFAIEWPPGSGGRREFAEVDRAGWFEPAVALRKIVKGQRPIIERFLDGMRGKGAPNGRGRAQDVMKLCRGGERPCTECNG